MVFEISSDIYNIAISLHSSNKFVFLSAFILKVTFEGEGIKNGRCGNKFNVF